MVQNSSFLLDGAIETNNNLFAYPINKGLENCDTNYIITGICIDWISTGGKGQDWWLRLHIDEPVVNG